jgi:hypothetical protein
MDHRSFQLNRDLSMMAAIDQGRSSHAKIRNNPHGY